MREILFRGKRVDNGEWLYGSFIPDLCELLYGDKLDGFIKPFGKTRKERLMVEVDRKTVGQYTGLNDKNGKKIFEGDIIRHHYKNLAKNGYTSDKGVVKWDCKECFFYRTSLSGEDKTISVDCIYEVIGNIYDNPELLEGKQ